MIKINVQFIFAKDGGVQDRKFSLKAACGSVGGMKKFQAAFGQCDITIGVGTGEDKGIKPFLNVLAIPGKRRGKYRFKVEPIPEFWFTWIRGKGGGLSFASYGSAHFEYNGHSLEIEKEGG